MALTTDREKTAHLLRRFGLGASESELDYYAKDGFQSAIDKLLAYEKVDEGYGIPVERFAIGQNQQVVMPSIMLWWNLRLMATRRPLQEKMTLFWHDHFATSAAKVLQPPLMLQQNEVLRRNATGNFRTLLLEASQDPAMLFWLDNQFNVRGKPNENFAREIMELFTLGIGHYSEKDIQEAARAFTGWTIRRRARGQPPLFAFVENLHDAGSKTFMGKTGNFRGEDIVNMLCENPQTARYVTEKVLKWFVEPTPDPRAIERYSRVFIDSGLEIKSLLREIMRGPEFVSAKAERSIYKNPVDFVIPTIRQLGLGPSLVGPLMSSETPIGRGQVVVVNVAMNACQKMGMQLLYPPDVDGWPSGPNWVTSATMVSRMQWGEVLLGGAPLRLQQRNQEVRLQTPVYYLFEKDPSPAGVVTVLASVFDVPVSPGRKQVLVDAAKKASGGKITGENANVTASAVCKLLFGLPEFQFC